MALIAEYGITFEHLPLVDVAAALPAVTLSVDVGQPNHAGLPPFTVRARGGSTAEVAAAFADATFVESFALVGQSAETDQYQVIPATSMEEQLGGEVDDLDQLRTLAGNESIVEDVEVTATGWRQRRWFADRAAFAEYRKFWQRNADGFSLRQLTRDEGRTAGQPDDGLTDRQQEALVIARRLGYFEVPRRASLGDVAAELGISAASASERLRRAQATLVDSALDGDRTTQTILKQPSH